MLKSITFAPDW